MIRVISNDKIRIKLTDRCNLECPFCHAEGGRGASDIDVGDSDLWATLARLRGTFTRVHLTGGEPTMHRALPEVCRRIAEMEYGVAITTNGLFSKSRMLESVPHLQYANVSIHSLRPEYIETLVGQNRRGKAIASTLSRNVTWLAAHVPVHINTVVTGRANIGDLDALLEFAETVGARLKLVPDYRYVNESTDAIMEWLERGGFTHTASHAIVPGSNVRKTYARGNLEVECKTITKWTPPIQCDRCNVRDDCVEGFSFIRMEGNPLQVRMCLGQPPIPPSNLNSLLLEGLGFHRQ